MKTNDPVFWAELTKSKTQELPNSNETQPEDIEPQAETSLEDVPADDSDLAIPILIGVMTGGELPDNVGIQDGGGLVSIAEAENIDIQLESESAEANLENKQDESKPQELEGRGKRSKFANKRYSAFWRHNDGDDWRDDSL